MINVLADFAGHQAVKLGDDTQSSCKSGREKILCGFFSFLVVK